MAKGFDHSAVCGPLVSVEVLGGHPSAGAITLHLNGEQRQHGDLSEQIWQVGETLAHLSRSVALAAGDIIYTGTPEGVGPMRVGDRFLAHIDGLPDLRGEVVHLSAG
jgi:fumarylpyruvate hydrolase